MAEPGAGAAAAGGANDSSSSSSSSSSSPGSRAAGTTTTTPGASKILKPSILAPSKFGASSSSPSSPLEGVKPKSTASSMFQGLKQSKLSNVTQGFNRSAASAASSSPSSSSSTSATAAGLFGGPQRQRQNPPLFAPEQPAAAPSSKTGGFVPLDKVSDKSDASKEDSADAADSVGNSEERDGGQLKQSRLPLSSQPVSTPADKDGKSDYPAAAAAAAAAAASAATTVTAATSSSTTAAPSQSSSSSSAFVFGENLQARAANFSEAAAAAAAENETRESAAAADTRKSEEPSEGAVVPPAAAAATDENKAWSAGSNGIATATAAAAAEVDKKKQQGEEASASNKKSLSESAAEYCESLAPKRKYDEVEVVTGEEKENNVIQTSAKLYVFDKSNWVERGRGTLRLNDNVAGGGGGDKEEEDCGPCSDGSSRLVMRTSGSLRVILNTPVFSGMSLESATEKTIRLTGLDDAGQVKVFLITTSPKDNKLLYQALSARLDAIGGGQDEKKTGSAEEAASADSKRQKQHQ